MALVNTYISHRNVTCPNYLKKKYKTVLPVIIWWKKNKSKTWGCPSSCLRSLKNLIPANNVIVTQKRWKDKTNSEKNTFFHTTYLLLPIFLPWHFFITYLLGTIPILRQQIFWIFFSPTHPTSAEIVLNVIFCPNPPTDVI